MMPVNPNELLESAVKFRTVATDEADYRSCISRYYYAGYHEATRFHGKLPKPGNSKPNVGEHENLVHKLFHPNIPNTLPDYIESKTLSLILKKILFTRRLVDYQLHEVVSIKNVDLVESQMPLIFNR